jgi:hypothetical protein
MNGAAEDGHLEVVKWLHANRMGCSYHAMDGAALEAFLTEAGEIRFIEHDAAAKTVHVRFQTAEGEAAAKGGGGEEGQAGPFVPTFFHPRRRLQGRRGCQRARRRRKEGCGL